jgi:hypothetical protein
MFIKHILNSLHDIAFQTRILEICEWDEEKAGVCLQSFNECLNQFHDAELFNLDALLKYLKDRVDEDIYEAFAEYLVQWIESKRYLEDAYEA